MANVLVHRAEDGVNISARAAKRLLEKGDGDAALLYLALLRHHGTVAPRSLAGELRWERSRIEAAEETLRAWSELLPGEAMGLLLLDESQTAFTPLVYVRPTDSCVWERGCGSGSAAIGAWLTQVRGQDQCVSLRQPGGAIQVATRLEEGMITSLTITGTVLIGAEKRARVEL